MINDDPDIDMIIATDVIYQGSPYDKLSELVKEFFKVSSKSIEFKIIIPKQRDSLKDFLSIMKENGFNYEIEELTDPKYTLPALENVKESDKLYPGLKALDFDLYTFK